MKTPYDPALRVFQRGIDELRAEIGATTEQLSRMDGKSQELHAASLQEAALASGDLMLRTDGYFLRLRAERAQIAGERREAAARLAILRDQATEAYGSLRAVEGAADEFRLDADRAAASSEQSASDDFAGARFASRRHRMRLSALSANGGRR